MGRSVCRRVYLSIVLAISLSAQLTLACPSIEGIVDYNCDGRLKIVITGDSIVAGAGDEKVKGGYPSRLRQSLGSAQVVNLGFNGIKTAQLMARFSKAFSGRSDGGLARATNNADVIILDVGRNDYHTGASPGGTVNRIQALYRLLKKHRGRGDNAAAIIVATLIPTTRVEQGAWVRSLNRNLLGRKSRLFPVLLRFESLSKNLLSRDGLHPGANGYARLAQIVEKALKSKVRKKLLRSRKDKDIDGVFDVFEKKMFGTDPRSSDSDGDGLLDGEELFEILSDPLDPLSPGETSVLEFLNRLGARW